MLRRSKTSSCLSLDTSCSESTMASSPDSVGIACFGMMCMSSPSPPAEEDQDSNSDSTISTRSDDCGRADAFFSPEKHHESHSRNQIPQEHHQHGQHGVVDVDEDADADLDLDYLLASAEAIDLNAVAEDEEGEHSVYSHSATVFTRVLSPKSPLIRNMPRNTQNIISTGGGSSHHTPSKKKVYISAKRLLIAQHWALEHQFPVEIVISSSSCLSPAPHKGGQ
jgi:hypothetical protein